MLHARVRRSLLSWYVEVLACRQSLVVNITIVATVAPPDFRNGTCVFPGAIALLGEIGRSMPSPINPLHWDLASQLHCVA